MTEILGNIGRRREADPNLADKVLAEYEAKERQEVIENVKKDFDKAKHLEK